MIVIVSVIVLEVNFTVLAVVLWVALVEEYAVVNVDCRHDKFIDKTEKVKIIEKKFDNNKILSYSNVILVFTKYPFTVKYVFVTF